MYYREAFLNWGGASAVVEVSTLNEQGLWKMTVEMGVLVHVL